MTPRSSGDPNVFETNFFPASYPVEKGGNLGGKRWRKLWWGAGGLGIKGPIVRILLLA